MKNGKKRIPRHRPDSLYFSLNLLKANKSAGADQQLKADLFGWAYFAAKRLRKKSVKAASSSSWDT